MTQEIEIEFKNLITKDEYENLLTTFQMSHEDVVTQTNYYFDTATMSLKDNKCAMRIRKKGDNYVLTLKEPHRDGLLETHQPLTIMEVDRAILEGILPTSGDVISQLSIILNTKETIPYTFIGELTTERVEKNIPEGLLVLDKSYYFDVVDYELEFECNERESGLMFFETLLMKNQIPKRETPNKILRFYNEKIRR